jgi:hypothetical protein
MSNYRPCVNSVTLTRSCTGCSSSRELTYAAENTLLII